VLLRVAQDTVKEGKGRGTPKGNRRAPRPGGDGSKVSWLPL
jgi:hypothetical protein